MDYVQQKRSNIEYTQDGESDLLLKKKLAKQFGEELSRIVEAAKQKEAKDYPKETSLIIVFDDGCNFRRFVNDKYLNTVV